MAWKGRSPPQAPLEPRDERPEADGEHISPGGECPAEEVKRNLLLGGRLHPLGRETGGAVSDAGWEKEEATREEKVSAHRSLIIPVSLSRFQFLESRQSHTSAGHRGGKDATGEES